MVSPMGTSAADYTYSIKILGHIHQPKSYNIDDTISSG
tara:strand:- start:432 stop:545 length:114 start_codon:yes stop_codon:yes gene_type:complete